jgi:flavodoxin
MKILIAYYSRTGTTSKIAKEIAKKIKADIDEIKDLKDRKGILGYIFSGRDSMLQKTTEIKTSKNPEKYDLVVVGTPVWAHNMTPAVRTYLNQNKKRLKKKAFFCSMGGSGASSVLKSMGKLAGKPMAVMHIAERESAESRKSKIADFSRLLK